MPSSVFQSLRLRRRLGSHVALAAASPSVAASVVSTGCGPISMHVAGPAASRPPIASSKWTGRRICAAQYAGVAMASLCTAPVVLLSNVAFGPVRIAPATKGGTAPSLPNPPQR